MKNRRVGGSCGAVGPDCEWIRPYCERIARGCEWTGPSCERGVHPDCEWIGPNWECIESIHNMYLKTYIVPPPGKFVSLVQPVSRWVCHLWVGTKQIYYPHPWRGALRVEAMVPSWRLGSFCGVFVYCIYDFVVAILTCIDPSLGLLYRGWLSA